jgi:hypothetical protein
MSSAKVGAKNKRRRARAILARIIARTLANLLEAEGAIKMERGSVGFVHLQEDLIRAVGREPRQMT